MKPPSRTWLLFGSGTALFGLLAPYLLASALAAELPKTIEAGPCGIAPTIDGVLGEDEWKDAATLKFDRSMVLIKPIAVKVESACELRVMNSVNALYVSLRIPTSVSHASLAPVDLDLAILAFCQGRDVAKGDDRKLLSSGLGYRDKFVSGVGKDEDDPQQDGRGAVQFDHGWYTFEWGLSLDTKDVNDLRTKPGTASGSTFVGTEGAAIAARGSASVPNWRRPTPCSGQAYSCCPADALGATARQLSGSGYGSQFQVLGR